MQKYQGMQSHALGITLGNDPHNRYTNQIEISINQTHHYIVQHHAMYITNTGEPLGSIVQYYAVHIELFQKSSGMENTGLVKCREYNSK